MKTLWTWTKRGMLFASILSLVAAGVLLVMSYRPGKYGAAFLENDFAYGMWMLDDRSTFSVSGVHHRIALAESRRAFLSANRGVIRLGLATPSNDRRDWRQCSQAYGFELGRIHSAPPWICGNAGADSEERTQMLVLANAVVSMAAVPIWFVMLVGAVMPLHAAAKWAILHRRAARGYCKCGYDLTGNVSGVCPECGRAVESLDTHTARVVNSDPIRKTGTF